MSYKCTYKYWEWGKILWNDICSNKYVKNYISKSFSNKNGVHINGIESFWRFTKRRLAKFNGVKSTFELHLKECEWRWRKSTREMENVNNPKLSLFLV